MSIIGMYYDFSERQWELLKHLPFQIFAIVAGADGSIDDKEIRKFEKQFDNAEDLENDLHREVLLSTHAEDMDTYVSTSASAIRNAYNAKSIVPMLKQKLDQEDYEAFISSLYASAVEIARASGGGLFRSSISKAEAKALAVVAEMFQLDPEQLKVTKR